MSALKFQPIINNKCLQTPPLLPPVSTQPLATPQKTAGSKRFSDSKNHRCRTSQSRCRAVRREMAEVRSNWRACRGRLRGRLSPGIRSIRWKLLGEGFLNWVGNWRWPDGKQVLCRGMLRIRFTIRWVLKKNIGRQVRTEVTSVLIFWYHRSCKTLRSDELHCTSWWFQCPMFCSWLSGTIRFMLSICLTWWKVWSWYPCLTKGKHAWYVCTPNTCMWMDSQHVPKVERVWVSKWLLSCKATTRSTNHHQEPRIKRHCL